MAEAPDQLALSRVGACSRRCGPVRCGSMTGTVKTNRTTTAAAIKGSAVVASQACSQSVLVGCFMPGVCRRVAATESLCPGLRAPASGTAHRRGGATASETGRPA